MLPVIAITLGLLIVVSRIPLLIWPEKGRAYTGSALQHQSVTSVLGLLMIGSGALIAYAAVKEDFSLEFVLWIAGATSFLLGVVAVVAPHVPKQLWDTLVFHRQASLIRASAGLGVLVGLFVLGLGLTWITEQEHAQRKAVQMKSSEKEHNMLLEGQIEELKQAGETTAKEIVSLKATIEKLEQEFLKLRDELHCPQRQEARKTDESSTVEPPSLLQPA